MASAINRQTVKIGGSSNLVSKLQIYQLLVNYLLKFISFMYYYCYSIMWTCPFIFIEYGLYVKTVRF